MESDGTLLVLTVGLIRSFYPRSPHGERLLPLPMSKKRTIFLSTLSAWRATWIIVQIHSVVKMLSIHALRMESDVLRPVTVRAFTKKHDGILSFAA